MDMGESIGVLGGTFDRLHLGHKNLILCTASECDHLQIHVVSDKMVKSKDASIQAFQIRKSNLETFLEEEEVNASIFLLEDRYGPAISMEECIVIGCTTETVSTCKEINSIRKEKGLHPLRIITVDHVLDEEGEILSSTRIRSGLVDQTGKLWIRSEEMKMDYHMPEVLDDELKQPMGTLHFGPEEDTSVAMKSALETIHENVPIIAVGDVTVLSLQESTRSGWISVIDGMTKRESWSLVNRISMNGLNVIEAKNPAGMLTASIFNACSQATSTPNSSMIIVEGEEDLTPIPLILMLPLDSVLMYGQPNEGLVVRRIDLDAKLRARRFLDAFIEVNTS